MGSRRDPRLPDESIIELRPGASFRYRADPVRDDPRRMLGRLDGEADLSLSGDRTWAVVAGTRAGIFHRGEWWLRGSPTSGSIGRFRVTKPLGPVLPPLVYRWSRGVEYEEAGPGVARGRR